MPRLTVALLLALSVAACSTPPEPAPNDVAQTTRDNVGNTMNTNATWGTILSAPTR